MTTKEIREAAERVHNATDHYLGFTQDALLLSLFALEQTAEDGPIQLLKDIDKWEAEWIMCNESWETHDGLPKLTFDLYDKWIELQRRRNNIIRKPDFSIENGNIQRKEQS